MLQPRKTIYVNSKNDPRYIAYQDSANIYNANLKKNAAIKQAISEAEKKYKLKLYDRKKEDDPFASKYNPFSDTRTYPSENVRNAVENISEKYYDQNDKFYSQPGLNHSIDPIRYSGGSVIGFYDKPRFKGNGSKLNPKNWANERVFDYVTDYYKKPTQPVFYKEDEKVDAPEPAKVKRSKIKEIKLKPADLVQRDMTLGADTSGLRPVVQNPKSYKIRENINQPFGGSQTDYQVSDLDNITGPNDLGPGNTRTITPQYAYGGQMKPPTRSTYENELMSRVITERNKDKNFVQRALSPNDYPSIINKDGSKTTHLMQYSTDNNANAFVSPRVVQNELGLLNKLTPREGAQYGRKTGQEIMIPDVQLADYYASNGLIKHADGGRIDNDLNTKYNNYLNNNMKQYAQGGQLTRFDEGGTHEQNPLGGVPQGQDNQGNMNTVEQGESKKGNFVYSNRIALDKGLVKQFNLPAYVANKSVSDASKAIDDKFKDRQDKYAQETKSTLLDRLSQAQEYLKQQEQAQQEQANQSMQANSQQVPDMMNGEVPQGMEEYAEQPQMEAAQQEQMMQGQQPMPASPIAAFGGYQQNRYSGIDELGSTMNVANPSFARPQLSPISQLKPAGLVPLQGATLSAPVMPDPSGIAAKTLTSTASTPGMTGAQIGAGALGAAGTAMELGKLAFGKPAQDTSGQAASAKVDKAGMIGGSALKGAQAGMAFGPWGAAIGGGVGLIAGIAGAGKAGKAANENTNNFAMNVNKQFSDNVSAYGGELNVSKFGNNSNQYVGRYNIQHRLGGPTDPIYGEGENQIKNVQSILGVTPTGNALKKTKAAWNSYQIPGYTPREKGTNYMYPWQEKLNNQKGIYTAMGLTPGGRQFKQSSSLTPAGVKSISAAQQLQKSIQDSTMDANKDGIRDGFANNPNINSEALKNFKIGEGINDNASLSYGDPRANDGVNFKMPNQTIMTPTDQYGRGVNTGAEQKVNLPGTRFSRTMNKIGQGIGENYGQAMRYAPVAMNAYQLSQLKKPTGVNYNTLDNKFVPQYVDEAQLQRNVDQEYNNQINAISQSGGSEGAVRSSILGAGLNKSKALNDAYISAGGQNRAMDIQGQTFNLGVDQYNNQLRNKAVDEGRADEASYRGAKSKFLSAIGTDVGDIGKEEQTKQLTAKLLGYDWKGGYIVDRKTGEKISPERLAKDKADYASINSNNNSGIIQSGNKYFKDGVEFAPVQPAKAYGGYLKTNKKGY